MRFRNFHAGCCGYVPTRSDGSEWAHVLTLRDGSTVYADSVGEVIGELVPGYDSLDASARRHALRRHAVEEARRAQRAVISRAQASGAFDTSDPGDAGLLPILEADKSLSLLLTVDERPGEQAPWVPAPELVLVTTSYAPHGEHPPIDGRVVWLDPTSEKAYLLSLRAAGLYDYWTA